MPNRVPILLQFTFSKFLKTQIENLENHNYENTPGCLLLFVFIRKNSKNLDIENIKRLNTRTVDYIDFCVKSEASSKH